MAGYEPKGKIEPDPEAPKHQCFHTLLSSHDCRCKIGEHHDLEAWTKSHPGEADTSGDR